MTRSFLLAMALMLPLSAYAADWPEHGHFRVQMERQFGTVCQLRAEVSVAGATVAFWVGTDLSGGLRANLTSSVAGIQHAGRVTVALDDAEVLAFRPAVRTLTPGLTTLTAPVEESDLERLRERASGARWLRVTAGEYADRMPATGLGEALADFAECRRPRFL